MKQLIIAAGLTVALVVPSLAEIVNLTGVPGTDRTAKSISPNEPGAATSHSQGARNSRPGALVDQARRRVLRHEGTR